MSDTQTLNPLSVLDEAEHYFRQLVAGGAEDQAEILADVLVLAGVEANR